MINVPDEDRRSSEAPGASLLEPIAVRPIEAARLVGASRSQIYRLLRDGKIDAMKSGTMTLVSVASLRRFVARLPSFARRAV